MKEHSYILSAESLPPTLAKVDFLAQMEKGALNQILSNSTVLECEPGETIIEEGAHDDALYILLKGRVRVVKGGTTIAAFGKSGELLGELALINDQARTASIVAESVAFCLKIDSAFLDELNEHQKTAYYAFLYKFLASLLADRLARTSDKLARTEEALRNSIAEPKDGDEIVKTLKRAKD